jgi:hypothetical protein
VTARVQRLQNDMWLMNFPSAAHAMSVEPSMLCLNGQSKRKLLTARSSRACDRAPNNQTRLVVGCLTERGLQERELALAAGCEIFSNGVATAAAQYTCEFGEREKHINRIHVRRFVADPTLAQVMAFPSIVPDTKSERRASVPNACTSFSAFQRGCSSICAM